MKHLVGKEITKEIEFMDDKVTIRKLPVKEVLAVQDVITKLSKKKDDEKAQIQIIRELLRKTVVGAEEMTDAEFDQFPLGELSELVEAAIAYSGMGAGGESEGN